MIRNSDIIQKPTQNNNKRQSRSLAQSKVQITVQVAVLIVWLVLCCTPRLGMADGKTANFQYTAEIPYTIGTVKEAVQAGKSFQGRICLLYTGGEKVAAKISLKTPQGITPVNLPEMWSFTPGENSGVFDFTYQFSGRYENWFELLQFQTDSSLPAGEYELLLTIKAAGQIFQETLPLSIGGESVDTQGKLSIADVLLPYDIDSGKDRAIDNATLILRNTELDYYKNLITGKGALSNAAKTSHPLTHMRLEWINPQRQPRLVLIKMRLLDKDSNNPVPGLISPEGSVNEYEHDIGIGIGGIGGAADSQQPAVFAELDGSFQQMMELPVYVDDEILKSGEYLLEISATENDLLLTRKIIPVKIVALDTKAALTTLIALILVLAGLPYILARGRLQKMKSRNLITAGLFGTTAFAVVNVPGNFLQDIARIFLGPFSFFVSGMFSGILLYMLLAALVVLIPRFGIITLMLMVRMLINMFVFGHISPVTLLIYGSQAVLLEAAFMFFGVFRREPASSRAGLMLAVACGLADSISTYIILQSFSFLYRLFYADWYIVLCMIVSGFIYPAIGASCGVYLGRELKKVGVD